MFKLKHLIIMASFAYIIVIGGGALGFRFFVSLPELKHNASTLIQHEIQQAQTALLRQEDELLRTLAATDFSKTGRVRSGNKSSFRFRGKLAGLETHLENLSKLDVITTEMVDEFVALAKQGSRSRVSYLNDDNQLFQLGIIKNNLGSRFVVSDITNKWSERLGGELGTRLTLHVFQDIEDHMQPNQIALLDNMGDITAYLEVHHTVSTPPIVDIQTAIGILSLLSLPIIITALVAVIFVVPMIRLIQSIKAMSNANQTVEIDTTYYIYELSALTKAFNELLFKLGRQQELLKHETLTDKLTGIPNRRSFDQTLEHDWRFALRTKLPITVVIADIDHFKNYNDHYGHQAGDEALTAVALALRSCCRRATEYVSRYGGEEFGLILQVEDEPESFLSSVNQAVRNLRLEHAHSSCADILTISIGACTFHPQVEDEHADTSQLESILKKADEALYKSKESGRNRFIHVVYPH